MAASCDAEFFRESRARFGRPQIIGHRGGKTFAPENTLAAFVSCLEHGGDACELDARLTADGELVVMHDGTVDRTTGGHGRIADLTLSEIVAFRVGGHPVPALKGVFEAVAGRGRLLFHVKHEADQARVERVLQLLARMVAEHDYEDRSTVLATKLRTLGILRYNPRLHLDVEIGPDPLSGALGPLGKAFFHEGGHRLKTSDFDLADDRMVRDAHQEGIPLVCWARDSSDGNVERLLRLGVDAIMTDYPERMGALIAKVEGITCER